MKKQKEFKPEYGIEYVFRFYNQRYCTVTQWNFIYDQTLPNGRYAFFKRQDGGIVSLDPRRFNHIMEKNLIEKKSIPIPEKIDYKVKLLEQERKRKAEEMRQAKEKSDAWAKDVLTQFGEINAYKKAEIEQRLSVPFEAFMRDVRRFSNDENLTSSFVEKTFKNILIASEIASLKLKAL